MALRVLSRIVWPVLSLSLMISAFLLLLRLSGVPLGMPAIVAPLLLSLSLMIATWTLAIALEVRDELDGDRDS